jgi:serine/threonine protein kinase
MKPIRDICCCPTFLIALAGPWICILGAVFVDRVVIQELTDFIWIGGHPYNDHKLESVTRILTALGEGIAGLEGFYSKLSPYHLQQDPQRFFPFVRSYSSGTHVVRFSYQAYLRRNSSKALFLATIESEDGPGSQIVVKFTQRYNVTAHRLLAAAHQAPNLLYCSTEDPNSENLGGLIMVVMGYVSGETAHQQYGNEPLPQPIFEQVKKAVETLHSANIVFADLRTPNIMINEERVMLIDFDWCGTHEEGTYPISLSHHAIGGIEWHPDVKRGGRMAKEHDIFRLNTMKPPV